MKIEISLDELLELTQYREMVIEDIEVKGESLLEGKVRSGEDGKMVRVTLGN